MIALSQTSVGLSVIETFELMDNSFFVHDFLLADEFQGKRSFVKL
jgi:hypothetical protein